MVQSSRLMAIAILIAATSPAQAGSSSGIPPWLSPHVGTGEGQIAPVVLHRARALYQRKLRQGAVRNPCYFAMDATRPSIEKSGQPARRFYVICENRKSFRAVSSGYGNGRRLPRANFANGRQCAKNFSNAEGSKLTAGGAYVTAETRRSFKGYIERSGRRTPFYRTFLLFDGEGDTKNARERAIGGHQAVFLRRQCKFKNPNSPHADADGFVPLGRLVNYTAGRSNGCTTWSPGDAARIIGLVRRKPTTLYIYPEGRDIRAIARAVKNKTKLSKAGLYWNASCLKSITAPRFWPKQKLQPVINRWRRSLRPTPPRELPICK